MHNSNTIARYVYKVSHNALSLNKKEREMHDLLNMQLISLLEENANQTSEELAGQLNVSSSTIRRRMKELIQQGILHVIAVPEPTSIGINTRVIIAFQVQHEYLKSVLDTLKIRKDVKSVYAMSGRYDVMAYMWFPSTDQLYTFMEDDVTKIQGVKSTETFICMHAEKTFWDR